MTVRLFCSGVVAAARREIERIVTSGEYRAVVWWLPLAVILFFAVFFSQEVVGALPVAVVDEDNTPLSRKVVSMIRATPQTALVCEMPDMETAHNRVLQGKVVAVVEIPNGFSKSLLSGETANVIFYDSGANISTNSLTAKGIQTAITTFGVGVSLQRAEMRGAAPDIAMAQTMPIAFTTYGLFNPWLNYAYYVAPCFWAMILIIAAVLSTIYAVGTELRYATSVEWLRSANNSLVAALMGKLAPTTLSLWLLSVVIGALIFGLFGAPMQGSWVVLAMGAIFLVIAYQAVALFIVALTASMRLSLSLGGGYSVLAFTFSGVTFPTMAMFSVVQPFTMLFPYTYFMRLYIDQAVRGSGWRLSMSDLAAMLLFCLLPLLLFGRLKNILVKRKFWCRL
ncbi:MAG: ABC transporter permease [Rikenellaceae bacterium]|nr:ABC transporter permease [Rikenellaceae bacterium]